MPRWLDRFLGLPTDDAPKALTLAPGGFVTEVRDLRLPPSDLSTRGLQSAHLRNELVYACIDTKATAALDPRLLVQRRVRRDGQDIYEEVPNHPFRQLLMRPNEDMTESDLMRAAIVSWDISNPRRFYCEKTRRNGRLIGLVPLDPSAMQPLMSRADGARQIGYVWSAGGERREYAPDDLLIRRAPAWYDPPPLVAALGAIESDSAQTAYVRSFFANGGIPPGLLKYSMPLNQPQRDEIRDKWRATYGNRYGGSHDIGVLDANVEFQQTGAQLDQLSSDVLRSVAESRICMVFKVPPLIVYAYVGLTRATYSNLKEAWSGFWDATMSPAFREWRMFWTWSLLSEFEDDATLRSEAVRLTYDMSQVSALQDDVDAIQSRAERAFRAGGITLNEFRAQIGRQSDPAGDYYLRLLSYAPQPAGETAAVMMDDLRADVRKVKARPQDAAGVQVIERRMEQALRVYLADAYQRAAAAVQQ